MWKTVVVLLAVLTIPFPAYSETIHVPDDYPTIQQAIYRSDSGDTIIVKPGKYVEIIDFLGKAITLESEQGAEATVIDGDQKYRVVVFYREEGPDSIIDGFTITNSNKDTGMYIKDSNPTVKNCIFSFNTTNNYLGGGMYNLRSNPTVTNCVFYGNKAVSGGGMRNEDSSPIVTDCLFAFNSATASGGGMKNELNSNPTLTNCTFYYNEAHYDGGGMMSTGCNGSVVNCIFANNSSNSGGGLGFNWGSLLVLNCVFYSNEADWGGGVRILRDELTCINTIFWNNEATKGPEIYVGNYSSPCTLTIEYSDLDGGLSSVYVEPGCTLNHGPGMIDADPCFMDPDGGDFHLIYTSPCRDTANSSVIIVPHDFEGDPRIAWGEKMDMGADEFYTHLYVTGDKTPGGSIAGNIVGCPGTTPVGLFLGTSALKSPMPTLWGDFWMESPWFLFGPLGAIPADGVMLLPTTLPGSLPAPYDLPMQALIGLNADSLSNLCVLQVR